jgi:prefoldin subunit 5
MSNDLEKQKEAKILRDQKPDRSTGAYESLRFLSSEKRTIVNECIRYLEETIKDIESIENKVNRQLSNKKEKMVLIGVKAEEIKYILNNSTNKMKPSFTKFCNVYFKSNYKRINECISLNTALTYGASKELSLSKLILMGQKLESKDLDIRDKTHHIIKKNVLPTGESLGEIKFHELRNALKLDNQLSHKKDSTSSPLQLVTDTYNSIEGISNSLDKYTDDLASKYKTLKICVSKLNRILEELSQKRPDLVTSKKFTVVKP